MFAIVLIHGIGISDDRIFNQKGVLPTRENLASLFRQRYAAKTQQTPPQVKTAAELAILVSSLATNHHDQFSNAQFPKS